MRIEKKIFFVFIFTTLGITVGCAKSTAPRDSLQTARFALQEAIQSDGPQYAPAELSIAEKKLREAEEDFEEGRYKSARRLSEQATVDARYAQIRAEAERAEIAALETRETVKTLQGAR